MSPGPDVGRRTRWRGRASLRDGKNASHPQTALQHVCNPTPGTPPTPCWSHLVTPSASHTLLNSANATSRKGGVEQDARTHGLAPAPLGPPSWPKAWLPAAHGGERERDSQPAAVWSSRTWANSGRGVLSWLREKPSHLLGR